jgi:hypothetical protein
VNEQEREVIADIFRRLEQVANEPRDAEAERFIAEKLRQQPYASYAMAQTIFIQERALANLQAEVESLRVEVEESRREPQASGGILASLFGGGPRPEAPTQRRTASDAPRGASPWGGPSMPREAQGAPEARGYGEPPQSTQGPWGNQMGQSRGGGFLQGALSTAAGVAGGMMMANALTSAFGGKHGNADAAAGEKASLADTNPAEEVADDASITNSLYDNPAEDQDDSFDDFGGDGGDEGDWA